MDPVALAALACPHCAAPLCEEARILRCATGHSFDLARHGYVNLSPGYRARSGDAAEMVAARERFLERGHYDPLAARLGRRLADTLEALPDGVIVDVGAGTGWLLSRLLASAPGRAGVAIDASKHAARRAARAHPRIASVVADAWGRLPVQDGAAGLVVDFFAPRNVDEFARILAPSGSLILITPAPSHLAELIERLDLLTIDPDKHDRIERSLAGRFSICERSNVRYERTLARDEVVDLIAMGPNAYHRSGTRIASTVGRLPEPMRVTFAFECRWCRRL